MQSSWVDAAGVVVSTVQNDLLAHDLVGNVVSAVDVLAGSSECFLYDHWNRLVRGYTAAGTTPATVCTVTTPGAAFTGGRGPAPYDLGWSFDDTSNLLSRTDTPGAGATVTAYAYSGTGHAGPHAPTSIGSTSYLYAPAVSGQGPGQTVQIGTDPVSWDLAGRLSGYLGDSYLYGPGGGRLFATHGTTRTLYLPGIEATQTGTGTPTWTVFYTINTAVTAVRVTTQPGTTTGVVNWYCPNSQGSTTCTTPANPPTPSAVTLARYTPYGQPRTTTSLATNHAFLGQPGDPTGLAYLTNRYYNPATGEFLTADPLAASTRDPYLYANGNPTTYTDPNGLCWHNNGRQAYDDGELCESSNSRAQARAGAAARNHQSGEFSGSTMVYTSQSVTVSGTAPLVDCSVQECDPFEVIARDNWLISRTVSNRLSATVVPMGGSSFLARAADELRVRLTSTDRDVLDQALIDEAKAYRAANPGKGGVAPSRNILTATLRTDEVNENMIAVSGRGVRPGTLGAYDDPIFKVAEGYRLHTEVKMFEAVARTVSQDAEGTLTFYSENAMCFSCNKVYTQFHDLYPNIQINIVRYLQVSG